MRLYVEAIYGLEASNKLFSGIDQLIIHSLKAVQNVMINDRHCFECYGYDVLIDNDLKPWLVEVNASPSLSTTTEVDRILKLSLLRDIYNIVAPGVPSQVPDSCKSLIGQNQGVCQPVGGFYVLYDEAFENSESKDDDDDTRAGGRGRKGFPPKAYGKAEWR